jgi:glutathione transport system substrate-binding protein
MKFFKSMTLGATMALTVLPLLATQANAETLTITIDSTLETLDPHNSTANAVASISNGVMQRLIGFDKDMKMVPMLAESWTVNDNATVFTFKLRQGVTFHDGTAFDAAAAKVNIDRLADQSNNLKRNSMMRVVAKTEVVDENTFRLTLKEPFGAMLATLAHPSIVMHSPKSLAEDGGDVSKHPVGTGPFVFNEWVPGERYSVVANPNYWEAGLPKVDGVNFLTVKETATSIAMLKADEAQFVFPLPPELFETVEADANFNILEVPGITVRTASMNMAMKPFQDPRVREAFNLAVDKNAFIQVVFAGHGVVPTSPIAANTAYYSAQEAYPFDLEKAQALMAEAGYADGFSIEAAGRNSSDETRTLQFLQQQLGQINVKVKINPMEAAARSARFFGNDVTGETATFGLALGGWSPSTGDADWHLRPVYSTEGIIPNIYNMAFYSNPKVDAFIASGLNSADDDVRAAAYAGAQKLIWEDRPVIWLAAENKLAGARADLSGVFPMPDGTFAYANAGFE